MKKFVLKDIKGNIIKETDDSFESYCNLLDFVKQIKKDDIYYQNLLLKERNLIKQLKDIRYQKYKMYKVKTVNK